MPPGPARRLYSSDDYDDDFGGAGGSYATNDGDRVRGYEYPKPKKPPLLELENFFTRTTMPPAKHSTRKTKIATTDAHTDGHYSGLLTF